MKWSEILRRRTELGMLAASLIVLFAMFMTGFLFLSVGKVHGSGSGGSGGCAGSECPPFPPCPKIIFEAVTGSGEYPKQSDDLSVSPELNHVYERMLPLAGGPGVVGVRVLPYGATSVDVLTAGLGSLTPDRHLLRIYSVNKIALAAYLAIFAKMAVGALQYSISEYLYNERAGEMELGADFSEIRARCPTSKLVLAGYSQGAMIVHDFLNQIAVNGNSADQKSVIGAVLLADPDRTKFSGVIEFGTAAASSYGVCDIASSIRLAQCSTSPGLQDVARMFQSRTVSVCDFDDPVCDTSNVVPDIGTHYYFNLATVKSFLNLVLAIHGSYSYSSSATLAGELMGRFAAANG